MNLVNLDDHLKIGRDILNDTIKIALYKEDNTIFDRIDFHNEKIYQEPLLFAYLNDNNLDKNSLDSLLCGYSDCIEKVAIKTDEYGRIYIPNLGWFSTNLKNEQIVFLIKEFKLEHNELAIPFDFEPIQKIEGTSVELLKYPVLSLRQFYFNFERKLLDVEIEKVSKRQLSSITKAYNYIKRYIPIYFLLIEEYVPKCVVFKNDNSQRNSFASLSAHGITFYNAFHEECSEVFFLDDIAKQAGHVLLNTVFADNDVLFKVDKNTILEIIEMPEVNFKEEITLKMIMLTLHSYYWSLVCLDACLENSVFHAHQRHEALGRITFYLMKFAGNSVKIDDKTNLYLSEEGLEFYNKLKQKCNEINEKWSFCIKDFDVSGQPYNFAYPVFLTTNPLIEAN